MRPKARTEALIVETLPDETLVYDERNDKAHCLNRTAARIWRMADGKHTVEQIARSLEVPRAKDVVWATLNDLRKARLLEEDGGRFERPISRREMSRRIAAGAAFVAIPAILTVGAPTAASAASCGQAGACCLVQADCCAGTQCNGSSAGCSAISKKACR